MQGKHSRKEIFASIIKNILIPLITVALLIYIWFSGFQYNVRVRERLAQSNLTTLSEIATQQQFAMNEKFAGDIASLNSVSYSLVVFGYSKESILDYLNVVESYYAFENITVLDRDKKGIVSSGQRVDLSDSNILDRVLQGETIISNPRKSFYSNKRVVLMATPIIENGNTAGIVAAEYPTTALNSVLNSSFEGTGYAFIIDSEGVIIGRTHSDYYISAYNLFDTLKRSTFENDTSFAEIAESIGRGDSGGFILNMGAETRIIEYRPLDYEDFSLIVAVPKETITRDSAFIIEEMNNYNFKLILGTVFSVLFVLFFRNHTVKEIKKAAYYDSLTGVPNLVKFKLDIAHMLRKYPNQKFTIVKMDIVNFKSINDFYDFSVGDKVIMAIADTGRTVKDKLFMQARIGHDEFLLFHTTNFFTNLDESRRHFEGLFRSLVPEIAQHNVEYRYGRYLIENNFEDVNTIINKVLLAHSYAKTHKETEICDYDEEFKKRIMKITEITNKQEKALQNKEFKVYLQPKCNMADGKSIGAEALVRWQEGSGNIIFPNDFIPTFEHNGFILQLDMYMLEQVCATLKKWSEIGLKCIPISVNFSRRHLEVENFVEKIDAVVNHYGVDKSLIEIELTEGIFFDNETVMQKVLLDLHEKGYSLSMDDFGTGYSSLGLLQSLPVDTIKMDRSFFTNTADTERANVIVASVAQMAQKLGIPTVAEGVETLEQVDYLQSVGCSIAQGYYYSKPVPLEEFEEKWLEK